MIKQVPTKNTTCSAVIRSKAFVQGFYEARIGKPLNYDAFPYDTNKQWDYERGRQFAFVFPAKIKFGAKVSQAAIWALGLELHNKSII